MPGRDARVMTPITGSAPDRAASRSMRATRVMAVLASAVRTVRISDARRWYYYAHLPIILSVITSMVFYFSFTAEDAYITYRYAENLVTTGALVYNLGEPINAMTSPLHALLAAGLYALTRQTVLSYKLVALVLLLLSALLVWRRYRGNPHWQVAALILVLMPPSIVLWTFGGLETPVLLFLATAAVVVADRGDRFSLPRLCAVFFLAGLAFLARYDSVLFFLPLLLHAASKERSVKNLVVAMAAAATLPGAWLGVSLLYYGDLLPTSFYVKTPNATIASLLYNGEYIVAYGLSVGLVPVMGLALTWPGSLQRTRQLVSRHAREVWWLYLGLLLALGYGLTMATHHMMFSFRFFVPYLPSAAIVAIDLVQRASQANVVGLASKRMERFLPGFLVCLALFQVLQTAYTYTRSVNGLTPVGEYRSLGVRDYVRFLKILKQEALDIETHWQAAGGDENQRPRILTYAAGMLPYTYKDSYIYEQLVSYRHCYQRYEQARYANYVHILAPRQGTVEQQLPKAERNYELVSSYQMVFDGSPQEFLVYYNPQPLDNNLTARITEPCQRTAASAP